MIGGNASENPDELTDEATGGEDSQVVTDIIDIYRLRETSYSKKIYQSDLKVNIVVMIIFELLLKNFFL